MAFSTTVKDALNRALSGTNLQLETLTASRREEARIERLKAGGQFDRAVFPVPEAFAKASVSEILSALPQYHARFDTFRNPSANDVGYCFANDYFRAPDAEVFYTLIRTLRPERIIEIGSGNSTRIARQAIRDGELKTHLISIDPQPRSEIDSLADECVRQPVEQTDPALFDTLHAGDFLFIDSSHEVRIGNDGAFLYGIVMPRVAAGVIVHIHDIFLPYDYPAELFELGALEWNEQYLVQAMVALGGGFEVLWPGYFIQRTRADFASLFPHNGGERAQSLWLRKVAAPWAGEQ
ncbi:MAG: class I SAM-dependent methyltransferase [Chthoniobacterales bacterium]